MHMLGILIFMTAAYQHNIARANGFCEPPTLAPNTVPFKEKKPINTKIRIQCAEGYVRKAGTSDLIRCKEKNGHLSWQTELPLQCIRDPKKRHIETPTRPPHFTSSTTERTEMNPTVLGTSMPTTATGHMTLTTTNEVVTSKTRRTTSQPTLKSTTKEAESFTTTNKCTSTNSTSGSIKSRDNMTTTSSHTPSSPFSTITEKGITEATFSDYTSTIGGVTSIIIICLAVTLFLVCWRCRLRRRETNGIPLYHTNPDAGTYIPVPVCASEHCSAEPNKAANKPTTDSDNDTNQPQTDSAHGVDTCDKLLPQTDTC